MNGIKFQVIVSIVCILFSNCLREAYVVVLRAVIRAYAAFLSCPLVLSLYFLFIFRQC